MDSWCDCTYTQEYTVRWMAWNVSNKGESVMKRYYVELKRNLKEKDSISFYMMAYNRTQIMDMFVDEYYIVATDITE